MPSGVEPSTAVGWKRLAVNYILHYIQHGVFRQELAALCLGKRLPVRIQRLVPFIDDFGIIRVRGRLTNSTVARNRFLVLLPKHHHLVGLLIHHTHVWLGHAGPLQVQFQLAQNYWILSTCLLYTSRCV